MTTMLLPRCICGSPAYDPDGINGVPVLHCRVCGVVRQDVALTPSQLAAWYGDTYHAGVYTHSEAHDRIISQTRLGAYGINPGTKLLDVGCGSGTFVDEAMRRGIDAWGQDLAQQSNGPRVYVGELERLYFPTESFDVVTIHDVLEHVPDPIAFLQEIKRILKVGGQLIVDFPRFWDDAGKHHWKRTEHLWMFTTEQLVGLLKAVGFTGWTGMTIEDVCHPIPSKIVVRCYAPTVERKNILVPAGIGDAFWVLTKLQGFMLHHGIENPPNIWVQDSGGPKRTEPFIRTVPFVRAAGYVPLRTKNRIWKEAYLSNGRTVYQNPFPDEAAHVDWFIAYNGIMRFGHSLEETDPQWAVDWHIPMHVSKEALGFKAECQAGGPYALVYLTDAGMYQNWLKEFPPIKIRDALRLIEKQLGLRMIFIGAEWDRAMTGEALAQREEGWIDLVGETTYDQMLGAILGASLVVGFPAGNTILATALKVPTVLLWNKYFDRGFWTNACAPNVPYSALDTDGLTVENLADVAAAVMGACQHKRCVTPEGQYTRWRCLDCGCGGDVP